MAQKSDGWREPSNFIAGMAAILSVLSLAVSVRICVASDQSAEIARIEFEGQRALILDGVVSPDNNSITLRPQDQAMTLQQAKAFFPSGLSGYEWDVLPPERYLPVASLRLRLEEYVERTVGRKNGYAKVALAAHVPVVLIALFTTKGQAFEDRSLYRIMFSFVLDGDSPEPPKIDYKGLVFVQHLDGAADARKNVDNAWEWALKHAPSKDDG